MWSKTKAERKDEVLRDDDMAVGASVGARGLEKNETVGQCCESVPFGGGEDVAALCRAGHSLPR
jgi:hypothetical protein